MLSDNGEVFTTQPSEVESVQLAGRDFSVVGTVKTRTGGGILSRFLEPQICQRLFIGDDGFLTFEDIQGNRSRLLLEGTTKIDDGQWHEVVITYEEQEGK